MQEVNMTIDDYTQDIYRKLISIRRSRYIFLG